jgi:hypothetical protein
MENERNQQGKMMDSEQHKQTLKEKKKYPWFRNNRISVLVVLVLLL